MSKRVFPAKDVLLGLSTISDNIQGVKPPKNLTKIGPNRHFTAKSTKRQDGHISVSDEHITVNFDRQVDHSGHYQKINVKNLAVYNAF